MAKRRLETLKELELRILRYIGELELGLIPETAYTLGYLRQTAVSPKQAEVLKKAEELLSGDKCKQAYRLLAEIYTEFRKLIEEAKNEEEKAQKEKEKTS